MKKMYFYRMKIVKRVFFCLLLFIICFSAIYTLFDIYEDYTLNINRKPALLFPIFVGVFGFLSLLFNLKKIIRWPFVKKTIYWTLRVGDFVFSITMLIYVLGAIYSLTNSFISQEFTFNTYFLRLSSFLLMITLCFILFLDNLTYHKEQKNEEIKTISKEINKIGK